MKKEIGSIFPLNSEEIYKAENTYSSLLNDKIYYSLCREALFDIALSLSNTNKVVLIPAYTCQTVITPFEEAGWRCEYYAIKKNLRIDEPHLLDAITKHNPSLLIVHPYFGRDLSDSEENTLQFISTKGTKIVLDLTQCLFSEKKYPFVSFITGSYRKWFPIPDGGFLTLCHESVSILQPSLENKEFTERERDAMYLRGQYFCNEEQMTKDISIQLCKTADYIIDRNISPHRISKIAYNLLLNEDKSFCQTQRHNNCKYLFYNIKESENISKVYYNFDEVTTAPLYYIIYVKDRPAFQHFLAQDSIYAPVIWPLEDERVLLNDEIKYIYNHLLAIPCDQRYDINDMQRVVEIINNYQA